MTGQKHSEVIHVTRQKNVGGHTYLLIKSTVFEIGLKFFLAEE